MMKRIVYVTVVTILLVPSIAPSDVACERVRPVQRVNDSGNVQGVVECPRGTPVEGAVVHIAGHSVMCRTDKEGFFSLNCIPESAYAYSVTIELSPDSVFRINDIPVRNKRTTDLGIIVVCSSGCEDTSACPKGYYCEKPVGDCDGEGTCAQKPTAWIEIYAPVCGCDGVTYSNSAEASGYGANVAYQGPCTEHGFGAVRGNQ